MHFRISVSLSNFLLYWIIAEFPHILTSSVYKLTHCAVHFATHRPYNFISINRQSFHRAFSTAISNSTNLLNATFRCFSRFQLVLWVFNSPSLISLLCVPKFSAVSLLFVFFLELPRFSHALCYSLNSPVNSFTLCLFYDETVDITITI